MFIGGLLIKIIVAIIATLLISCAHTPIDPVEQVPIGVMFESQQPDPLQSYHTKSSSSWTGWNKFWFGSAIVGQGSDAYTTINALDSGGCKEVNPILGEDPSSGSIILIKIAATGACVLIAEYILDGHPKQQEYRNWAYGALAVIGGGAAIWNSSQKCD